MTQSNPPSVEELRPLTLFIELPDDALALLASELKTRELKPGDFVFREGQDGQELFVLLSGEIEVLKESHRGDQARVALLGPGDWFGEMSVIDVQPRSASVRALAESRLLCVTADNLKTLSSRDLAAYARVLLNVAREMSRRLRVADTLLADFVSNIVHRQPTQRCAQ